MCRTVPAFEKSMRATTSLYEGEWRDKRGYRRRRPGSYNELAIPLQTRRQR